MKFLSYVALVLYGLDIASSASIPQNRDLSIHESQLSAAQLDARDLPGHELEKRKGGGGKGSSGSSGSSSGSSSSGSSSSGKSGSSTSSTSKTGSSYSFSSASNAGGRTREGSGVQPSYGGYYAGGARVPYTAGARTPTGSVAPYFLGAGALTFFPGVWLYGAYAYPMSAHYYYNHNGRNESTNVTCLCQEYSVCGCDDNGNQTYIQNVVGNGTDSPVNSTIAQTITYANGTQASFINGTLPNGTTASGGTDPSSESEVSGAARLMVNYGGYWVMAATVAGAVMAL